MAVYRKLDPRSLESMPSSLMLFDTPLTQAAIEKTYEREYITLNPHTEAPYIFKVFSGPSFIDPERIRIVTTWRMWMKKTANLTEAETAAKVPVWIDIPAGNNISVSNGMGSNFIRNLKVSLGGQMMFNSNNLYPIKSMIDTEFNYTADAKSAALNSYGYYYDPSGLKGAELVNSNSFKDRADLFSEGKFVEFSAPLLADIFQHSKLLPSHLDLDIEIYPTDQEYMLVAPGFPVAGDLKLELQAIRLYVTFLDLQPGVALDFERRLEKEPCRIPVRGTELKPVFLAKDQQEYHGNIFPDIVPRTLSIVLLRSDNYMGTRLTDPNYFEHAKIRTIQVRAGNVDVPFVQFEFDWAKGKYVRGFEHLHRTVGLLGNGIDCGINRKMYQNGYTIFPFNLTTSQEDEDGFDFVRDGPTSLVMKFQEKLDATHYAIMYGSWDALIFIDKTRNVRTDLNV